MNEQSTGKIKKALKVGGGVYLVAFILLISLGIFLSRSDGSKYSQNDQFTAFINEPSGGDFSGDIIPAHAPKLGPDSAKIKIVEFSDFGCPFCKQSFPIIRQIVNKYPDDVQLVYRHFPVEDIHPGATALAHASFCAQEQGGFWKLHDRLFQQQDQFDLDELEALVESTGLNTTMFRECQNSLRHEDKIQQDFSDGLSLGARGTPTWFVNGQRIQGSLPLSLWESIIEDLL